MARPQVDTAAFDAAFVMPTFMSDDIALLKSELASVATTLTPTAHHTDNPLLHQLPADLQMAPVPGSDGLQRQLSFSELPMITALDEATEADASGSGSSSAGLQHNRGHGSMDLSLDIMQSLYGPPDSPVSSPDGSMDSGNASDTSSHLSSSFDDTSNMFGFGGSPSDTFDAHDEEENGGEEPRPFSKARPFAKKSRATFLAELTEEERALLQEEGVHIPADGTLTLTKAEERQVKRVRRKIKNKMSAQESRKKKKEYVDGLEARVEQCTCVNVGLRGKINTLEKDNKSLLQQLKELQAQVQRMASGGSASASTCLMLLGLCFSVYLNPAGNLATGAGTDGAAAASLASSDFAPSSFNSRTLKSLPASLGAGLSGDGSSAADTLAWFNTFFKEGSAAASEGRPSPYDANRPAGSGSVTEIVDGNEEVVEESATRKRKSGGSFAEELSPASNVSAREARLTARLAKRSRGQGVA